MSLSSCKSFTIVEAAQSRDEATPRPGELQEFPKIESALQDIQTEREKMSREASTSGDQYSCLHIRPTHLRSMQ